MAVIGSIRKRTGLLIGFIAVALLMFLLMDALSSNSLISGGSGQDVGKINGKKVDYLQYQMQYSDYENRITTLFPQAQVNASNRAQFRDEVWNNFAADALLGKHLVNMGIAVTADELGNSMFGDNVHFFAQNILVNPQTGRYDPQYANALVQQAQNAVSADDPSRILVRHLENLIEEDRMKNKYSALYTKGIYVPGFEAREEKAAGLRSADIQYIYFPYSEVDDSEVTYTDRDLEKYIRNNEDEFIQEEAREIKFYTIDIIPSVEDSANALAAIEEILAGFRETDDDSLYVRRYSDLPFTGRYQNAEELTGDPNAEAYFTDEVGTFYGPYFYNGAYNVAKLKDRKNIPDSVSARHILLVPQSREQYDSLQVLADSLIQLIENGSSDFAELAPVHSKDESNKHDGGDLGFFSQGVMVPPFNDAAFYHYEEGDVYKVESRFGIHIVKIDEADPTIPTVKVAVISQELDYSKDTERELFREANNFRTEHNTLEKFVAAEGDYLINTAMVTKNQVSILGLTDARDLVQWSFKEKVGSVNYFDIEDKYIVALISGQRAEGAPALADVRIQVEQEVKNELKAKMIADRIRSSSASNIQELASATGKEVQSNPVLTPAALTLSGTGAEPAVIGSIFGLSEGSLSGPLEGTGGVYVVQVNSLTDPGVSDENYFVEKARLRPNITYQGILTELMDEARIDDSRYLFY
jgi:peptidyl-prolyl cis-trans isomerase D